MLNLPVELLAHVFVLGSEVDMLLPVSVSHVCHRWRVIALHTPSLWRRICLGSKEEMWKERIRRAKACPLDIQFLSWTDGSLGSSRPPYLDYHVVQWYMHFAMTTVHRWRSLDIEFTHRAPFLWNAALSQCCADDPCVYAPLLQELRLISRNNDDTKEYCLFAGFAPQLRHLTLDGIRLTWLPSLYQNLTHLDYTHNGFTNGRQAVCEFLNMLEVSSRIVELKVSFPWKEGVVWPRSRGLRKVLLSRLTHLDIRITSSSRDIPVELSLLMFQLSNPSLLSLRLLDNSRSLVPFRGLDTFMRAFRVPPRLRTVRIENGWCDHRVVSVFHTASNLQRLVVKYPRVPEYNLRQEEYRRPL